MKIIYNNLIPFGGYSTINLFGILFTKRKELNKITINHEAIHTAQMKELGYVFFYLIYILEYLYYRFSNSQNEAYHKISFEKEAYMWEEDFNYLERRKHFAQW